MSAVRPSIARMAGYTPGEQINENVVKLNTNENPYPPSPRVVAAVRAAAGERLRLYPQPCADDLRAVAAKVYGLPAEWILAGNGSDDLLTILFRTFVGAGETAVTFEPTYTLYESLAELQDGKLVYQPFADDFGIPAGFRDNGARMVILANPNSPTGTFIPRDGVRKLAAAVTNMLVVDEAYADFARENCLDLVRERPNVIVLRSFSKSYSMAGVRLGLAFARPEIITAMVKVKDSYNVDRLSAVAGAAALEDQAWMLQNTGRIKASRAALAASLAKLGLAPLPSESNFIFVRCPGLDARRIYLGLKEARVLVRYFDAPRTRDGLRITVGTEAEIAVLMENLTGIVARMRKEK
ncbi:MAG: histidinol-phosphate transaminase [Planctomycetota bacterium]